MGLCGQPVHADHALKATRAASAAEVRVDKRDIRVRSCSRPCSTLRAAICGVSNLMLLIRPATIHDVALLRTMIRELAEYQHELDRVTTREEDLARDGFGAHPRFRALIAESDGHAAGYALFFGYYSTWVGRGLFLEDLFVRETFRRRDVGKALLAAVALAGVEEQCYGIHWEVLDWNEKAIELYLRLGALSRSVEAGAAGR